MSSSLYIIGHFYRKKGHFWSIKQGEYAKLMKIYEKGEKLMKIRLKLEVILDLQKMVPHFFWSVFSPPRPILRGISGDEKTPLFFGRKWRFRAKVLGFSLRGSILEVSEGAPPVGEKRPKMMISRFWVVFGVQKRSF